MIDDLEDFDPDADYSERIGDDFQWWLRTRGRADKASRLLNRLLGQSQRQRGYVEVKSPAAQVVEEAETVLALECRDQLERALEQMEVVMAGDRLVWVRERWGDDPRTLLVGEEFAKRAEMHGAAEIVTRPSHWLLLRAWWRSRRDAA